MENDERRRYTPEESRTTMRPSEREREGVSRRAAEARGRAGELGRRARRRARRAVDERRPQVAGRMDRLGHRLRERGRSLEPQGGVKAKAGRVVGRVGERVERGADYVRTHEIGEMQSDLKIQVRDHPLTSVAVAVGAGFLLGRIVR